VWVCVYLLFLIVIPILKPYYFNNGMTLEVPMFVKNVEIVLNKRGEIYYVFRLIKSII